MINTFAEFPEYIREFMKKRYGNNQDFERLIRKKVPFFRDKTLIEVINEPNGEDLVIEMFNEMTGHYGGPYLLRKPSKGNKKEESV